MNFSTVVNIVLCVLSFILAAISVVTVVITLRQNHKMIENSTRPYISVYIGSTYFSDTITYLIIKNFGQSSGEINSFESDLDFAKCSYDEHHIPFEHIVGTHLCPGESIQFPIDSYELSKEKSVFYISLRYSSGLKNYSERIPINFDSYCDRLHLRANSDKKRDKEISFALQDIAEKLL